MKRKNINAITASALLLFFLTCSLSVFSQKEKLKWNRFVYETKTEILVNTSMTYSIATHDQRPVILDGSRTEDFVGYIRSTAGVAGPVSTASGNNFSHNFSTTIAKSLSNPSQNPIVVETTSGKSRSTIISEMKRTKSDRFILVTIYKWRSDSKIPPFTRMRTDFLWDVLLEVHNESGKIIATNRIEGLNPEMANRAKNHKKLRPYITQNFKEKIDELFNTSEIKEALTKH